MEKIKIKIREKNAIIESLKLGLVPRIGLQHIQVGRADELKEMIKDFDLVAQGCSKTRFVIGEYGSGKTFFLTLAKLIAHEKNMVVMSADVSMEKILTSSEGKARRFYAELITNMSTKTKPDGGALKTVIEKWASMLLQKNKMIDESIIFNQLSSLDKFVSCYDFSKVLYHYIQAYQNQDDVKMGHVMRWLRGEYKTKTEAQTDLGVRTIIDDDSYYDYLKLWASFVRLAGYEGLVICVDELAILARLRANSRNKNYEKILNIINDTAQGSSEFLEFIFSGTPTFLDDTYRGMYSYGALATRLANNPFAKKEKRDLSGPVIRLENLSQEELFVLFHNIRNVFAEYDESKYLVSENDIQLFMQWLLDRLGAKSFLSPRESVKSFIGLLSQLENYPETNLRDYLQLIKKEEDTPSSAEQNSDDLEEDDELVSLRLEE